LQLQPKPKPKPSNQQPAAIDKQQGINQQATSNKQLARAWLVLVRCTSTPIAPIAHRL
jgi:hypothetical protein